MTITEDSWIKYIGDLRKVNDAAAQKVIDFLNKYNLDWNDMNDRRILLDYAYSVSSKYGAAATELACEMYDEMAELSGVSVAAAAPAELATYGEVAKAVNGVLKYSQSIEMIAAAVARQVKMAGVDTTMQNALRDGAQWAWIPSGDTCAFCITLASRGWQRASKKALKNGHAEHIHANCDCTYAIRFNENTNVQGYTPDVYKRMYDNAAPGAKPKDKINAMRREFYEENKAEVNAQKRSAYEKRKEREASSAEEINVSTLSTRV